MSSVILPAAADSLTINPDTATYDYYPSTATADDGALWTAWHAYRGGQDQIVARLIPEDGAPGILHVVSQTGNVHGPPVIIVHAGGSVSVVWASMVSNRWSILWRSFHNGEWLRTHAVSHADRDAIQPTACRLDDDRVILAWSENLNGVFQIHGCVIAGGMPSAAFPVSSSTADAFRPELVVHDEHVWAFWDTYNKPNYSVQGRRLGPVHRNAADLDSGMEDIETVSPIGEFSMSPTAISHGGRLYVAWLRKADVVGGPGVISQWHTLHSAFRTDAGWDLIHTAGGDSAGARLTQGLMAQIEPKPIATGGYLGPRTRPALTAGGDRVWLLWERKSNHRGSTPSASGDLVGRPIQDGLWQEPVVLARNRIDYHVVDPPAVKNGTIRLLASRLPSKGLRRYETFSVELDAAEPFQQEDWRGWAPVDLPIGSEIPDRSSVEADGKTYQLYWGDLHCHNALTADAEGEPDEMHAYARDRARLDVVVFTNNDFYNVPLTQYEFELGNLFARFFTKKYADQPGQMISLPGFEWTSRIPGVPGAALADSGNWMPPYQNRSYPNHRSVIYPPTGGPLVHFTEVGNDIRVLNHAVERANGITLSQHNAFQLSEHPVEVGLELTSGWSVYIASHVNRFHDPLNKGARYAFTASGDTHRRAPGLSGALTGIYAEALTADAILDALRSRRCFATMGSRIHLDARADGALMGQEISAADSQVTLTLRAVGTRPIVAAVLIRDGQEIHRVTGSNSRELTASFKDTGLSQGHHWYYWRIAQDQTARVLPGNLMPAHGHLAWSTPHWVVVE